MERQHLVFILNAENHANIHSRVLQTFSRSGTPLVKLQTQLDETDTQHFVINVHETWERARRISLLLKRQVDVLTVDLYKEV
jgi:acetolactate synthase small subunit